MHGQQTARVAAGLRWRGPSSLLGPPRPGAARVDRGEMPGDAGEPVNMYVESGLAVGLYLTVVDLLRTIEHHLEEGYRRVKIRFRSGVMSSLPGQSGSTSTMFL